jgi:hypothetical protein
MNQNAKKTIKVTGMTVFFILILGYAFFVSRDLIFGIKIKNVNLENGSTITERVVKVNGNAKNAIKLTLNGREISIDEKGNFDETIALMPGYNIVNVTAQDKFGYMDQEDYKLMYK